MDEVHYIYNTSTSFIPREQKTIVGWKVDGLWIWMNKGVYGCVKGDFGDENSQGCDENLLVLNDVLDNIIGYEMED